MSAAYTDEYLTGEVRGPLNLADRRRAGFTEAELERLQALCHKPASAGT